MKIALTGFMGPWGQVPTLGMEFLKRGMLHETDVGADWLYCHDPDSLLDLQGVATPHIAAKVLDMNWADTEPEKAKEYIERLSTVDCVLVNTGFVGQQIREMGYTGEYHIVGDPVNIDFDIHKVLFGNTKRNVNFFTYGRVDDPSKRLSLAVATLEALNEMHGESYELFMAGMHKDLEAGLEYGIAKAKGFLNKSALTAALLRTKVVLAPSVKEGLGLIPIEAVTCGAVPVVAAIPVMREVWGDTIPMFEPDDIDDYVNTLNKLRSNNFEWDLGPASEIAATYTPQCVVDRIIAALEN